VPGVFRSSNPLNLVLIFFIGMLLRYQSFVAPVTPELSAIEGFLYRWIVHGLVRFAGEGSILFPLMSYLLVFLQALLLNAFVNQHRMFGKPQYLVAFSYVLVTALRPEWWQFSPALLVNTALIPVWNNLVLLNKSQQAKSLLFSTGIIIGLSSFIYFPALAYFLLLLVSVLILRPFRLPEWINGFMGLLMPYYFLFSISFLTDQWDMERFLPLPVWNLLHLQRDLWTFLSLLTLFIPLAMGLYHLQNAIGRLAIHSRKAWNLVFYYFILSMLVPLPATSLDLSYFFLTAPTLALIQANVFFYPKKRYLPNLLVLLLLAFILLLNLRHN